MKQSPSKGQTKKKAAVNRVDGPLVLYAEYVLKKLLCHKIPCDYSVIDDGKIVFVPKRYHRPLGADFRLFLSTAVRIVNADKRVRGGYVDDETYGHCIVLDAPHHIDIRGELRLTK